MNGCTFGTGQAALGTPALRTNDNASRNLTGTEQPLRSKSNPDPLTAAAQAGQRSKKKN